MQAFRIKLTIAFLLLYLLLFTFAAFADTCTTQTTIGPRGEIVTVIVCCDRWGNCVTYPV